MTIARKLFNFLRRKEKVDREALSATFRQRYARFRELLESNAELARIMSDIESRLSGADLAGMSWLQAQSARAVFHASRMVRSLEALSGRERPALDACIESIRADIKKELDTRRDRADAPLILSQAVLDRTMSDVTGGKNANLGEVRNRAGLPVPEGFAITTAAYDLYIERNGLGDEIAKRTLAIDPARSETLVEVSEAIQELILKAEVPEELGLGIKAAYASEIASGHGAGTQVAMRSSAIGEDGELSFAGQYLSMLNVTPDRLLTAYKYVIASLFTPRALMYRLSNGIPDDSVSMSVACIRMIDAAAGGVIYTRDPNDPAVERVLVTSVPGLGTAVVDGRATPDVFETGREEPYPILVRKLAPAPANGGPDVPSLTDAQASLLAGWAMTLERHYGRPQDVEFALDKDGAPYILQARPLAVAQVRKAPEPPVPGYAILLEGGAPASGGVGAGPVHVVSREEDLNDVPQGAVLVARHSSPKFVLAMPRLAAILTDSGSVTGHMASLAREYGVPALLDARTATRTLVSGQVVTVDADNCRVYDGSVPELAGRAPARPSAGRDTPVSRALRRVADRILPLNLIDPKAQSFTPAGCRTIHDIMRFVHERSYSAMFRISDLMSGEQGWACKLDAHLPLDLYVIDLGGGLTADTAESTRITLDQVLSAPFQALLAGACDPRLSYRQPRAVNLSGFFSVMGEQMLTPQHGSDRFGDRSYALISDKYLNFSSRVGYHYGVVDAYCGDTVNKNYITFSFRGGAADDVRRNRRARSIGLILERLDFSVESGADRVDARFQKYPREDIAARLAEVGRLLLFTRQMDMLMTTESSVTTMAEAFLRGDYDLEDLRQGV